MPELPEVETIVRELGESNLIGLAIQNAMVHWPRSLARPDPATFCYQIKGQKIVNIIRRGKYLLFTLSQDYLIVHLRMTGKFMIQSKQEEIHPHERIRLSLSDGRQILYEDQRKFGKWYLVADPSIIFSNLGIEPLSPEFTLEVMHQLFKKHNKQLKSFLLDQSYITGLGNIYVDEALWEAKLHPLTLTGALSENNINNLHKAIIKVLKKGIENTGTSLGDHRANYFSVSGRRGGNQYQLNVFRRDGEPCPRCGTIIVKTVVSQRGTHLCPCCQIKHSCTPQEPS